MYTAILLIGIAIVTGIITLVISRNLQHQKEEELKNVRKIWLQSISINWKNMLTAFMLLSIAIAVSVISLILIKNQEPDNKEHLKNIRKI